MRAWGRSRTRRPAAAGLLLALLAVLLLSGCGREDTRGGSGIRYQDRMYWSSSAVVRAHALGQDLGQGVPFEDTTADLRSVQGVDLTTALAVRVHGRSAPEAERWLLFSADGHHVGDPWSDDELREVVEPQG